LSTPQLPLFGVAAEPEPSKAFEELERALKALDPDNLSPRQAHAALYALRALLERE
jgi:DNA mismatch repair protein MutS